MALSSLAIPAVSHGNPQGSHLHSGFSASSQLVDVFSAWLDFKPWLDFIAWQMMGRPQPNLMILPDSLLLL